MASGPSGLGLLVKILSLSLSASIGLIFLLNIIATHGALTCSTIMTARQFVSIMLNGMAFGTMRQLGALGWTGIGYVASGVWVELSNKKRSKLEIPPGGLSGKHREYRMMAAYTESDQSS